MRVLLILASLASLALAGQKEGTHANLFAPGEKFDLHVYLSEDPGYSAFDDADLAWHVPGLAYSDSADDLSKEARHAPSPKLLTSNSTRLTAHILITKAGCFPVADAAKKRGLKHDATGMSYKRVSLVRHKPRRKTEGLHNLLTGAPAPWEAVLDAVPAEQKAQPVRFWVPRLHVSLVYDESLYKWGAIPGLLGHFLMGHALDEGPEWFVDPFLVRPTSDFTPIIFVNELALVEGQLVALNGTSADALEAEGGLPLELHYSALSISRFQWFLNLRNSFAMQEKSLGISEKESEEMRGMFVHTNPVLLYATIAVSTLHLLFDVLAFKADFQFWRSVETTAGLSARAVVMNFFMELVILLYLHDQGASWLVVVTSALSLVMGLFKIFKTLTTKRDAKGAAGVAMAESDKYDKQAFNVLMPPLVVVVVGFTAYTLLYDFHKGWLSWGLGSLTMLVYALGFVVMTPQLFINYKMKSVACLPWRFFMYKALNTFIDDLFAFIIKMPAMHRAACFRDDIVFVVFLYQRWIYPVDVSRRNEFGITGEEEDAKASGGAAKAGDDKAEDAAAADDGGDGEKSAEKKKEE